MRVDLYELQFPGSTDPPPRFETLRDAVMAWRRWGGPNPAPGCKLRRVYPRCRKAVLERLLAECGLGYLKVWYRTKHPAGWMVCEEVEGDGYQLLGNNFPQAVDAIRGDSLWCLWEAIPYSPKGSE